MNQIWMVEAHTIGLGDTEPCYQWAFPDRTTAHNVYHAGERSLSSLRWSLTMVQYGNEYHALHDIGVLKLSVESEE